MNYNNETPIPQLEPRVAKLEVGLDKLSDTVKDLAGIVRSQGEMTEKSIQSLTIAVTKAQGPRQTDWGTIISAIFLMLAVGSAVFWPLNKTCEENKDNIKNLQVALENHVKLDMHPVGIALVQRLEERLTNHEKLNQDEMKQHEESDNRYREENNRLIREEMDTQEKFFEEKLNGFIKLQELVNQRIYDRTIRLEKINDEESSRDKDELRFRRLNAELKINGGNAIIVPFISPMASNNINKFESSH